MKSEFGNIFYGPVCFAHVFSVDELFSRRSIIDYYGSDLWARVLLPDQANSSSQWISRGIPHNEILLMADVPKHQVAQIEQLVKLVQHKNPSVTEEGISWTPSDLSLNV